jgi:hypothetical protein
MGEAAAGRRDPYQVHTTSATSNPASPSAKIGTP